jgi:hypothetical protein
LVFTRIRTRGQQKSNPRRASRGEHVRAAKEAGGMLSKDEGSRARSDRNTAARIRHSADAAIAGTLRAGFEAYDRARDLPRLTRLAPRDFQTDTIDVAMTIVARLERALRSERNRARSGHWTYDLNRHIALRQAYVAESERLRTLSETRS